MADPGTDARRPEAEGVYFARSDYAGLGRRLAAGVVDAAALTVGSVALVGVWSGYDPDVPFEGLRGVWLLLAFAYLGPVKRSRVRTLGYRVAGVRVVDHRGAPPSLAAMLLRSGLYLGGAVYVFIDFFWMLGQERRQKLTDQIAGTYVVRARARPEGRGAIVAAYYGALTNFLVVGEIRPLAGPARKEAA